MADLTASQQTEDSEKILAQILDEINCICRQMQQERTEINRLKAESSQFEAETKSILARLKAMV